MPTSSFDTFFACTIIVAAALIGTGFICATMQVRIDNTRNINQESYLQAIANHIVTNPGTPSDWGASNDIPADFGLAVNPAAIPYQIDIDKISRLNSLNNCSLSYFDMENTSKLEDVALGISVSQIMDVVVTQVSNYTSNNVTYFIFSVSTSIDSQPVSATLNSYVIADNYVNNVTSSTSNVGASEFIVQVPFAESDAATVVVFARASFDSRITSYAIFNLATSTLQTAPPSSYLSLSPLDYNLNLIRNSTGLTINDCYVFTYAHQQSLIYDPSTYSCEIPRIVDESPMILFADGFCNGTYFQEWVSYPQVPFSSGSPFSGSEQNVFSYEVTINGVLYKLEISLGGTPS